MTKSNGSTFTNGTHVSLSSADTLVNEASIEKYVRFGVLLTEEEKLRIEERLEQDDALKSVAAFYQSFYEAYDELEGEASSRVDTFTRSLFA